MPRSSVKFTPFRSFLNRFEIGPVEECWPWQGYVCPVSGYGAIKHWVDGNQKLVLAHRESYQWFHQEPAPPELVVRHRCHNRLCVNPHHLVIGTHKQNMWDTVMDGRQYNTNKTHCKRGHPLFGSNLYVTPTTGARQCRTCHVVSQKEAQKRRRARV